jgi:hypothetical protein
MSLAAHQLTDSQDELCSIELLMFISRYHY